MKLEQVSVELERVRTTHGGMLKPADVVEFAKNPDTALHSHFEWDDTEAARAFRLVQARTVIQLVFAVVTENTEPVRAFISLPSDRATGGGYRSIKEVLSDEGRRGEMLRDVIERLAALKRKYSHLSELVSVWSAISSAEGEAQEQRPSSATG